MKAKKGKKCTKTFKERFYLELRQELFTTDTTNENCMNSLKLTSFFAREWHNCYKSKCTLSVSDCHRAGSRIPREAYIKCGDLNSITFTRWPYSKRKFTTSQRVTKFTYRPGTTSKE